MNIIISLAIGLKTGQQYIIVKYSTKNGDRAYK
jgi:hypothetical protein